MIRRFLLWWMGPECPHCGTTLRLTKQNYPMESRTTRVTGETLYGFAMLQDADAWSCECGRICAPARRTTRLLNRGYEWVGQQILYRTMEDAKRCGPWLTPEALRHHLRCNDAIGRIGSIRVSSTLTMAGFFGGRVVVHEAPGTTLDCGYHSTPHSDSSSSQSSSDHHGMSAPPGIVGGRAEGQK